MGKTTLSSREFNQDTGRAKKAAEQGPVIITDRGKPTHVLMTFEAYRLTIGGSPKIADLLALPGVEDIEFQPPRLDEVPRPADLS